MLSNLNLKKIKKDKITNNFNFDSYFTNSKIKKLKLLEFIIIPNILINFKKLINILDTKLNFYYYNNLINNKNLVYLQLLKNLEN